VVDVSSSPPYFTVEKEIRIGLFEWSDLPSVAEDIRATLAGENITIVPQIEPKEPLSGSVDLLVFINPKEDHPALRWASNWPVIMVSDSGNLRAEILWRQHGNVRVVRRDDKSNWLTVFLLETRMLANESSPVHWFKRIPQSLKQWSLALDRSGGIAWCGHAWEALGVGSQEVPRQTLPDVLLLEPRFWKMCWSTVVQGGQVSGDATPVVGPDGHLVVLEWELHNGRLLGSAQIAAIFLATDVSEALAAHKRETNLRQSLQVIQQDMDQIVEAASHDLKEPLRNVSNFVQLLQHRFEGLLDEDGSTYIRYAVGGVKRMWALMDELLLFASLRADPEQERYCNVSGLIQDALTRLDNPGEVHFGEIPERVYGHPGHMELLFRHLLDNAFRFNPNSKRLVGVEGLEESRFWIVTIWDNGPVIAKSHQEKSFLLFKRGHSQDQVPGRGMGLAVARKIMQLMGGRIQMVSSPNQGTAIHLWFPKPGDLPLTASLTKRESP
jgi:signal transduction histidine kinase